MAKINLKLELQFDILAILEEASKGAQYVENVDGTYELNINLEKIDCLTELLEKYNKWVSLCQN